MQNDTRVSQLRDTSLVSECADSAILHYAVFEKEQALLLTENKCRRDAWWGTLVCPVIELPVGTSHSGTDSLIQVISVAQAEANSNDELQYANHMVDAASLVVCSDLRLSV